MSELKEKDILNIDEYSQKLKADYSFESIDFTKLSKDDSYLITITFNADDYESKEYMVNFCKGLKNILSNKGINDVIIVPLKNGEPLVDIYKKGNANK